MPTYGVCSGITAFQLLSCYGMVWYDIVEFNVPLDRHSIGHFGDGLSCYGRYASLPHSD